jgi:aminopeptidase N
MPKRVNPAEFNTIISRIAAHPGGLPTRRIHTTSGASFARRTLQRRIAELMHSGRIIASGTGRSRKYLLPNQPTNPNP